MIWINRLIFLVLLSLLLIQPLYAAESRETKRVLVLYSEAKDLPAHEITERGIHAGFRSNERFDVQLCTEYLEASRFGGPSHARVMVDYLGRKYSGREIDAIIAVYPYAVDFLLNERLSLFPGVPIIAAEIDRSYAQALERSPARRFVTGNIMGDNITALADVALLLRPKTKRIALVAGTSPMNVHSERVFRRDLGSYAGRIELLDLTKLSMVETLSRVASLPPDTLVFYSAISTDGAGKNFVPREALSLIARASTAPVFSIYESYLGFGIVGGPLVSYEELGRESAALALHVMAGESPASIPFGGDQAYVNAYDWRQLKRWGIAEGALPPGSTLRFKEFSVWEQYRWWIVGLLAFLCLETLLIGALFINLVKRKRVEEALTRSESKLKKAQEVGIIGSFTYDVKADEVNWAVGANEIWGVPPDVKLDYESFLQIVHPDDRTYVDGHWKAALKGEPYDIEHRVAVNDKVKWVRSKVEVEFDERGNPLVGTGVVQDINRRKQMEEDTARLQQDLVHVARVSTMGEVSQTLAHELNQPLTAILVNAEAALSLLDDGQPDLQEVREALGDIVADHTRMRQIIQRIRTLVKKDRPVHVLADLNRVASDAVKVVQGDATARQARILLDLHADLPVVRGDVVQLQQVVLNLLVNALEAVDQSTSTPRLITIKTAMGGENTVTLSVSDTGIGVDKQMMNRLFQPFFTTKSEGLGLGLSISQSIIEGHGGAMGVFPNPERGVTFYFSLPAVIR